MLKTLLMGVTLGVIGKKLYDEGRLEPYLAAARKEIDKVVPSRIAEVLDTAKTTT